YVSPQVEALLGFSAEEWLAIPGMWQSRIHPDDRDRVLAEDERTERSGETFIQEYRMVARDDSIVWVRDEAVLLRDAEGNPHIWLEQIHPDDVERVMAEENESRDTLHPLVSEYRMVTRDGRVVWLRDEAEVLLDPDGTPQFMSGVMLDITDRKAAEEQLRETEAKYRAMVEHIPAVLYIDKPDDAMTPVYVSPQIETMLGVTAQEYIDDDVWEEYVHPEDRERAVEESRRGAL